MAPNSIIHTMDEGGRKVALVPLAYGRKGYATVDDSDLTMLIELGLSLKWNRLASSGIVKAPAFKASGNSVSVARVLLDLGFGQSVEFIDRDPTNLRRSNLQIRFGSGTRRDRDFLTPLAERRPYGPKPVHVYLNNNNEIKKDEFNRLIA